MHSFISTIISLFFGAVGVSVIIMVAGTVLYVQISKRQGKEKHELSLRKLVPTALLMGYLGGLITITLFIRTTGDSAIQWHLFCAFREAWNTFTLQAWLNPLLNIGMFVPLGLLLSLVTKIFRRWYVTLAAGFGGSLLIEAIQ